MSFTQFKIIGGDCVEVMTGQLKEKNFDLIITDPPYNIGVDYGEGPKADLKKDYRTWSAQWLRLCFDRLRDGGSIYVVSGQEFGAHIDIGLQEAGFTIRNRITWHETFGVYCHNKFGRTSRPIYYAVKGKNFTFNGDAVRVPSDRQKKYKDRRANPKGKIIGDVWNVPRVCGTHKERQAGFPTQLPSELVRRMIRASSNKGESILDPFSGSGTVGMAALILVRCPFRLSPPVLPIPSKPSLNNRAIKFGRLRPLALRSYLFFCFFVDSHKRGPHGTNMSNSARPSEDVFSARDQVGGQSGPAAKPFPVSLLL